MIIGIIFTGLLCSFQIRDALQNEVSNDALKGLLEYNKQEVPRGGESKLLERVTDAMMFGPLKPCPECGGQLVYSAISYHCTGQVTEWTKCLYKTREPKRGKFRVSLRRTFLRARLSN